jgi:hypothetical protein
VFYLWSNLSQDKKLHNGKVNSPKFSTDDLPIFRPLESKDVNLNNLAEGTKFFKDLDKNTENEFQKDLESIRNTSPLVITE